MHNPDSFNILIIDDSDLVVQPLTEALSDWLVPEHLLHASSVTSGLKLYRQSHPAVIVLDVRLPDGNGIDILTAVRQQDKQTKVIVLSSFDNVSHKKKFLEHGADYNTPWIKRKNYTKFPTLSKVSRR